jgi:hypothetical protein
MIGLCGDPAIRRLSLAGQQDPRPALAIEYFA